MKIILNFLAVILLLALIAAPIHFARNFAQVAGVKSESKFLIVSQAARFPGMKLVQEGEKYQISFTKQGSSQAFLGILIINNPTENSQTYRLEVTAGSAKPFFGEDLDNQIQKISLPSTASVPISLFSGPQDPAESQLVEFRLIAEGE